MDEKKVGKGELITADAPLVAGIPQISHRA